MRIMSITEVIIGWKSEIPNPRARSPVKVLNSDV
jgi:hypothetical protein